MNAYLFSGMISYFVHGHFTDGCASLLIYGGDEDSAWKAFEDYAQSCGAREDPSLTKVEKVVGAPVLEQLFTEAGPEPIDWPNLDGAVLQSLEHAGVEEAGQGYWVDPNECLGPSPLPPNLESLQNALPDDLRSELNWAIDKTYFFIITVLSPPAPEPDIADWTESEQGAAQESDNPDERHAAEVSFRERLAAFPEMADKELAVLVRARNSVVAAWLWKRYALSTPLAGNRIRLDSWCGAQGITNH